MSTAAVVSTIIQPILITQPKDATLGLNIGVKTEKVSWEVPKPRDVKATLYYIDWPDGAPPPVIHVAEPSTYYPPKTAVEVVVRDIRGTESSFTLDNAGFQIIKHNSCEKEFKDKDKIRREYYPEMIQLLKTTYVPLIYPSLQRQI